MNKIIDYDKIYFKSKNTWGLKPSELLQIIIKNIPEKSTILDLGSAQGRDALYLASLGHNVTAVEKSAIGNAQLRTNIEKNDITNIIPVCEDILNFKIEQKKFNLINIQNVLQFFEKEESLIIISDLKNKLCNEGFIIISSFTKDDPSFFNKNTKIKGYFEKQELLNLFSDFQIIFYYENTFLDNGHTDYPNPHYHCVVQLIAKKVLPDPKN